MNVLMMVALGAMMLIGPVPQAARDYMAGRRLDEGECILADIAGVARGKAR